MPTQIIYRALILSIFIHVQSKRLRIFTGTDIWTCIHLCQIILVFNYTCNNSSFNNIIIIHLSKCYLTKFEAAYITWVVSFCACVLFFTLNLLSEDQSKRTNTLSYTRPATRGIPISHQILRILVRLLIYRNYSNRTVEN